MGVKFTNRCHPPTWNAIAISMGITEDYYGYYDDEFLSSIEQTIEDMLVEANPYCHSYKQSGLNSSVFEQKFNSVELLDRAWHNFRDKPSSYYEWERLAIQKILGTDSGSNKPEINSNGFNLVTAK